MKFMPKQSNQKHCINQKHQAKKQDAGRNTKGNGKESCNFHF